VQIVAVAHPPSLPAGAMLGSYERIRKDRMWMPVLSTMEEGCWCEDKQEVADFKRELASLAKAGTRLLSVTTIRRLQACFWPLVSHTQPKTHYLTHTTQMMHSTNPEPDWGIHSHSQCVRFRQLLLSQANWMSVNLCWCYLMLILSDVGFI